MKKRVLIVGVGLAVGIGAVLCLNSLRAPSEPPPVKAAGMAASLGISADQEADPDRENDEQHELEMLKSGEAAKRIEREIEKAEALLAKHEPGSDQHRMLSRRLAMLKRLKEKMKQ